jgi:hypothetical protein
MRTQYTALLLILFRIHNNFHQEVSFGLQRTQWSESIDRLPVCDDQQLTNYRQEWGRFERDSNHSGLCYSLLRHLSSAFPDVALIYPVTIQMRSACSMSSSRLCTLQCLFWYLSFLIHRLVLRFSRAAQLRQLREADHVLVRIPKGIPGG